MKRKMNDSQADSLQTRKSERTAARAAKCTTGCGQGTDGGVFRKGKADLHLPASIGNQDTAMYIHQPRDP